MLPAIEACDPREHGRRAGQAQYFLERSRCRQAIGSGHRGNTTEAALGAALTLTEDLHTLLEALDVSDVTLVGFSMGGGEVARYFSKYGADRVHSVVFAAAVPPYLMKGDDNPEGPLTPRRQSR